MSAAFLLSLIGLVFTAVSFVVLGDTAGKLLTASGVEPVFVAWTRFALAAVLMLPFSGLKRAELHAFADWRVITRALAVAGGISSILTALATEPIANVFGAFFIGPIVSFAIARLVLKERTTRARAALLGLGFVGVLLVVKPGFGFTPGLGWALLAGVCYGTYLAITRMAAPHYRPRLLLISQLLIGAAVLAPMGLAAPWPALDGGPLILIAVSAGGSALGNYLLVIANRHAPASLIAPLIYTQLISATLAGFFVFGDWPDTLSIAGLMVILSSGLATLWLVRREM